MRYVLVDANHYAHRCRWGTPNPREGSNAPGVVSGFLSGMKYVQHNCVVFPEQIICIWDSGHSPERKAIAPDYKSSFREKTKTEEELEFERSALEQEAALKEMLPSFGIRTIIQQGVEADDMIAFASEELVQRGHRVVIVSGDGDFRQLVSPDVSVFDSKVKDQKGRVVMLTEEKVCSMHSIKPPLYQNFLRIRAMAGDKSDSIGGIHGVGPKKSAELLPYWDFIWNDDPVVANKTVLGALKLARQQRDKLDVALKCIQLPTRLFSEEKEEMCRAECRRVLFEEVPCQDHDAMLRHLRDWGITTL